MVGCPFPWVLVVKDDVMAVKVDWAAYDKSLMQRGNITFWLSDDMFEAWYAQSNGRRGGQRRYSDIAIETALTLRSVFGQALRQTEGLLISLFDMMSVDLDAPDYTTLSRRALNLDVVLPKRLKSDESITIAVDSTGLKIYGAGEWCETKHGLSRRRQWRKLHITLNTSTLEVVEASLTDNNVGDSTEAKNHIENIDDNINEILGDGAYDCKAIYKAVGSKGGAVTIPPPANAVFSNNYPSCPTQRDRHVEHIKRCGRSAWEIENKYSRRLLAENYMGRFKGIIGPKLRSRKIESQKVEAMVGCAILNRMAALGTPTTLAKNG